MICDVCELLVFLFVLYGELDYLFYGFGMIKGG